MFTQKNSVNLMYTQKNSVNLNVHTEENFKP
jgi:hypothetical protein